MAEMSITLHKDIPVIGRYEVIVCGGGPSGIMAAVAAAREGASVALIERYGFVGGMATAGMVNPISVFRYNDQLVVGGIPWELVCRMEKAGGAQIEYPLGNVSIQAESFKLEAQRMLLEAGVTLYLHAWVSDVLMDANRRVTHVVIVSKSGTQALAGRCVVDCTGDGDILHMAGVPMQSYDGPVQPASLEFLIGGVDTDRVENIHHSRQGVNYHVLSMQQKLRALAQDPANQVPNFGGPWFCWTLAPGQLVVNCTRIEADMADERDETRAECMLREDVHRMVALFREHFEPFRNAYLIATAPQAGARETRHMRGAHVLTGQEYLNAVPFPDAIGRGCHPIDIHSPDPAEQRCHFLKEPAYIPYRCLYAPGFPNLLVGSRCLSADREASASIRVMASIMGIGQAAGVAAAQSCRQGVDVCDVDVHALQGCLIGWGAVLGQAVSG